MNIFTNAIYNIEKREGASLKKYSKSPPAKAFMKRVPKASKPTFLSKVNKFPQTSMNFFRGGEGFGYRKYVEKKIYGCEEEKKYEYNKGRGSVDEPRRGERMIGLRSKRLETAVVNIKPRNIRQISQHPHSKKYFSGYGYQTDSNFWGSDALHRPESRYNKNSLCSVLDSGPMFRTEYIVPVKKLTFDTTLKHLVFPNWGEECLNTLKIPTSQYSQGKKGNVRNEKQEIIQLLDNKYIIRNSKGSSHHTSHLSPSSSGNIQMSAIKCPDPLHL